MDFKNLPQAIDIEKAVLGEILTYEYAQNEALNILKHSDVFHDPKHIIIFEAIDLLFSSNLKIDLLTVSNAISKEKLNFIGGHFYLVELMQLVASGAHIEFHCRLLQQFYIKRKIILEASRLIRLASDEDYDSLKLLDDAADSMTVISDRILADKKQITLPEALVRVEQRVELLSNKQSEEILGLKTGFKKLDAVTGGWQNEALIVIAARPGMGKSALTSRFILENALVGDAVGVISLEMSTVQFVTRLVSNNSNYHLNQLFKNGFEKEEYFAGLKQLNESMKSLPIYFNETPSLDIRSVVSQARTWKREKDLKILIIDYLQLITVSASKGNREQEIALISRTLKALAKELKIPVIALAQLSRSVETRGGSKRPMLSDLRESGAIEQDADVVAFIYRAAYYNTEVDEDINVAGGNTEFILAKHRAGSLGTIPMWFNENKTKFEDPEVIEAEFKTYNNVSY